MGSRRGRNIMTTATANATTRGPLGYLIRYYMAVGLAYLVASVISLFRPIVRHNLSDDECEAEGLPAGSRPRAIFVEYLSRSGAVPWWYVDAWADEPYSDEEASFNLQVFGFWCTVYFVPKAAT
jgi:hypothetical protein